MNLAQILRSAGTACNRCVALPILGATTASSAADAGGRRMAHELLDGHQPRANGTKTPQSAETHGGSYCVQA
jgi:hypothetical protein